jgi:hypothetical protein
MAFSVKIEGLKSVTDMIGGFSGRRLNAAQATILTRLARQVEGEWLGEIFSEIDRPTSFTMRSVVVKTAKASALESSVFISDRSKGPDAPAPVDWMAPHEYSGGRYVKKFERALMAMGAMGPGLKAVPARHAVLDQFGNVSRGQITQVIAQLGTDFSPGYQRTISKVTSKRIANAIKHGRKYIAFPVTRKGNKAGVYELSVGSDGKRALRPVFYFVSRVQYRKRTSFAEVAQRSVEAHAQAIAQRTIGEHVERIKEKKAG